MALQKHLAFGAALLCAITVLAYVPALRNGFIWDDDRYITANATLRTFDGLRQIWFAPGSTPQYYPLTLTTFWTVRLKPDFAQARSNLQAALAARGQRQ